MDFGVHVSLQAKQLEENIFIARDAHYTPSVMELELETRLNQLTDHLIQKQSQVILGHINHSNSFSNSNCILIKDFKHEAPSVRLLFNTRDCNWL